MKQTRKFDAYLDCKKKKKWIALQSDCLLNTRFIQVSRNFVTTNKKNNLKSDGMKMRRDSVKI